MLINLNTTGRIQLSERDQIELVHRMSTNDLAKLGTGQGAITVLTTPVGRIIDLLTVLKDDEITLAITGRERGEVMFNYLRRNIFYSDRVKIEDITQTTELWGLYGEQAADQLREIVPDALNLALYSFIKYEGVYVMRVKPLAGHGFWLIGESDSVTSVKDKLLQAGVTEIDQTTYDQLRIEAGYPAVGHELTEDYIPLETGLWDAVSFSKGCYTGQEIIARMESRGKLAKMLVCLHSEAAIPIGTELYAGGHKVGSVTSTVPHPDGYHSGLGYVKSNAVHDALHSETGQVIQITKIAGTQPERET